MRFAARLSIFVVGAVLCAGSASAVQAETKVQRGKYLATIMDCGGCHTTGNLVGQPQPDKYLGGSDIGWLIPDLGVFYPPNLTPDRETGLGSWSDKDVIKALRTGITPEGRQLAPLMPWRSYSALNQADMEALVAFLRSVPAVNHVVPGPTKLSDVKTPYFTVALPPK